MYVRSSLTMDLSISIVLCHVSRKLLGDERFLNFVKENPQVKFQTELKGARHPVLIGDYSECPGNLDAANIPSAIVSNIAICCMTRSFLQSPTIKRSAT